jgi:SH3-like domain-containing protein
VVALVTLFLAFTGACKRAGNLTKEVAYVNSPQVVLRDRLAPIFEKRGTVKLGDKVYVLDHQKRFSLVRTERGEEGWIADRYLVDAKVYGEFEKLAADNAKTPIQAKGTTRNLVNLHVSPGRDTEHLFQFAEGEKVDILKRGTAEKPAALQPRASPLKKTSEKDNGPPPGPALEDWSLIRGANGRVGWVLARMVDIDVPIDIAQYAEGQRIVSSFVLNTVPDEGRNVPQYLLMLTDNKDGLPFDYNQIRVFSWNLKRHRYETAYRERNLEGYFPVTVSTQDFGKEGVLPTFTLRVKDSQGKLVDREYRMIGPIVRRLASPEELKAEAADRAAKRAAEPGSRRKKRR